MWNLCIPHGRFTRWVWRLIEGDSNSQFQNQIQNRPVGMIHAVSHGMKFILGTAWNFQMVESSELNGMLEVFEQQVI